MLRRNLLLGVAGVAVLGVTGCATHREEENKILLRQTN